MNLQVENRNHERKLSIIEMIELCEEMINREKSYMERYNLMYDKIMRSQTNENISRFKKIKSYLLERYNRS